MLCSQVPARLQACRFLQLCFQRPGFFLSLDCLLADDFARYEEQQRRRQRIRHLTSSAQEVQFPAPRGKELRLSVLTLQETTIENNSNSSTGASYSRVCLCCVSPLLLCFVLSIVPRFSLALSPSLRSRLSIRAQGLGLMLTLASLLEHLSMGQAFHPQTPRDHTLCDIRAVTPTLAVWPPHVCHRQETGQDVGIS